MLNNQSRGKLSFSISFLLVSLLVSLFAISSCKDGKDDGDALKNSFKAKKDFVNFLVNDNELPGKDRIGGDIIMKSYLEDYRRDKDHVHYVNLGDTVIFEDISTWVEGSPPDERTWMIGVTKSDEKSPVFKYFADIEGTEYITLKFTDQVKISKGVVVVARNDDEPSFAEPGLSDEVEIGDDDQMDDQMASIDEQPNFDEPVREKPVKTNSKPVRTPEPVREKQPVVQPRTQPKSQPVVQPRVQPKSQPVTTTKPAPAPKPVAKAPAPITNVDFSASSMKVKVGESIIFRDQSVPAASVKQRVWDWGDGNTMNSGGSTAKNSYYKAGSYQVKLCLNYTSKCKTKTIVVEENAEVAKMLKDPEPEKKPEPVPVKKVELSRVTISSASTGMVGKAIEIKDDSYPAEAVESRTWYINGAKANFTSKKFNKAFDKQGTYTIKLCVNGASKCESKTISIKDKPKPPPPPPVKKETTNAAANTASTASNNVDDFYPMEDSFTGLRSSQRCTADNKKWHSGKAEVILAPKKMCQLLNATVYGKKVGRAKVTLAVVGGKFTRSLKNVQILPGGSTVEFGDLAIVLEPGKKYSITIEPMDGEEFSLEDGGACNTTFAGDNKLDVEYKDNIITLYEIRFEF